MNTKKTILLDVDEVICFSGYLEAINEFLDTHYIIDDFTDYYIDVTAVPKDRFEAFHHFLGTRNLYQNAVILPDAVETIKKLNEVYEIYICSACVNPFNIQNSGKEFLNKYNFLIDFLPFLDPNHFIFTSATHLFNADIQIDDRLPNLDNDVKLKILFPSYHNKAISDEELKGKGVLRAGKDYKTGWKEIEKILLESH